MGKNKGRDKKEQKRRRERMNNEGNRKIATNK